MSHLECYGMLSLSGGKGSCHVSVLRAVDTLEMLKATVTFGHKGYPSRLDAKDRCHSGGLRTLCPVVFFAKRGLVTLYVYVIYPQTVDDVSVVCPVVFPYFPTHITIITYVESL